MAQELKDYDIMDIEAMDDERLEKSSSGRIFVTRVYITDEVDAVLAEKDADIRRLQRALWLARAGEAAKEVNYWTCENESSYAIVDFNVHHETIVSYKAPHHRPYKWIQIWKNVERKCRTKAEEFK